MVDCQQCIAAVFGKGPATSSVQAAIESIDEQKTQIQRGCENQCCKIVKPALPFSIPVQSVHKQREAFTNFKLRHKGKSRNSNIIRDVH